MRYRLTRNAAGLNRGDEFDAQEMLDAEGYRRVLLNGAYLVVGYDCYEVMAHEVQSGEVRLMTDITKIGVGLKP